MEKVECKRIVAKNIQAKRNVKQKKLFKNSRFEKFLNFEHNKVLLITFLILFLMASLFSYYIFSNNTYYVFIKKPQILSNAFLLALVLTILSMLTFAHLCIYLFFNYKNKSDLPNNKTNLDDKILENNEQKIDENTKEKKFKKYKNKGKIAKILQNNAVFFKYFSIFLIFLILLLSFALRFLWLCAFVSFIIFFMFLCQLFKAGNKYLKIVCALQILTSVCNLLSFYFLYLLN